MKDGIETFTINLPVNFKNPSRYNLGLTYLEDVPFVPGKTTFELKGFVRPDRGPMTIGEMRVRVKHLKGLAGHDHTEFLFTKRERLPKSWKRGRLPNLLFPGSVVENLEHLRLMPGLLWFDNNWISRFFTLNDSFDQESHIVICTREDT